jgi:two-component system sensor histidine kinase/response regulator
VPYNWLRITGMNPPPESSKPPLAGRRILIVDDDRLNARILASILKPEGYELAVAHSGEECLECYEQFKPDLVLLDVIMPGITGFETCRTLRDRHGDGLAPVVFITAKSESDDVVEGLAAGGVDYLPKPFKGREALARLRTHLQNRLLTEQQRQLVAQLSTANTAKNRLLGMVAHDLRNPLASIRGLADFLSDGTVGKLTDDQLDLVKTIQDTSQSMLTMVNELLDLTVIESGELKIHPEMRPIAELLNKSVYLNNINAAKKGSLIELAGIDADTELCIDSDKVKQVIDNLLSNAIKFSPPSSTIHVAVEQTDGEVSILVRDQGPGIPEGERHKLFKDFGQTSVKPTAGEKSTGLGLAICKRIMESHGGTIAAESVPTGGSIFRITFPRPLLAA